MTKRVTGGADDGAKKKRAPAPAPTSAPTSAPAPADAAAAAESENYLQHVYRRLDKYFTRRLDSNPANAIHLLDVLFVVLLVIVFGLLANHAVSMYWARADTSPSSPFNDIANMNVNDIPTMRLYYFSNSSNANKANSYERDFAFMWKKLIDDHCTSTSSSTSTTNRNINNKKNGTYRTQKNVFVSCIFVDCGHDLIHANPATHSLTLRFDVYEFPCIMLDFNPMAKATNQVTFARFMSSTYSAKSLVDFIEAKTASH